MLKEIINIIPINKLQKLKSLFIQSLLFNLLDLISIAYLIPVITLLLDKEQFYSLLNQFGITSIEFSDSYITFGILFMIVFYVMKNIFHIQFNKSLFDFLYRLSNDLSLKVVHIFINSNFINYQKLNKGDVINMVMKVAGDFSTKLIHSYILFISEIFVLLIITCVLLYFYPTFTLISLLILGLFSFFIFLKKKSQFNTINTTYNESLTESNSKLINIIDGYLDIKSSNNEAHFLDRFKENISKLNTVTANLVSTSFNYTKYLETSLIFCLGLLAYFSLNNSTNNILLISTLGALGFKLIPSLSKILNAVTHIKSHSYTINKLTDFLKTAESEKDSIVIKQLDCQLSLKDLSFHYQNHHELFKNIDFTITPKTIYGISGVSGVGKTTFLHILMGLIKPTSGKISVDNVKINHSHLLAFISYVPQQPLLLEGTLLENFTMGEKASKIDEDYLTFLCENLKLDSIIDQLPDKYHTHVQHDSHRFSGGQKQRISIVRALYKKPKILILDEATNQQNKKLEEDIYSFLVELAKENEMAIVSVSHNSSLNKFYDKSFLLENNKLIELDS